jgi:DNA-binding response OmpR family regulator
MKKAKILYLEDEESLGMIVSESMLSRGYEVIYCKNAKEALFQFENKTPDICVLDIMMEGMDGYELAELIHKKNPAIPFLFLSAKSQTSDVVKGFQLGAHDYVKKPFSIEELLVRVDSIISRNQMGSQQQEEAEEYHIGNYSFHVSKQTLSYDGSEKKLTHRETEVLKLLCLHKNEVLERTVVLDQLWGDDSFFNARSMDVFITKLRKYLQKDPRVEIINVRGVGYKLIC